MGRVGAKSGRGGASGLCFRHQGSRAWVTDRSRPRFGSVDFGVRPSPLQSRSADQCGQRGAARRGTWRPKSRRTAAAPWSSSVSELPGGARRPTVLCKAYHGGHLTIRLALSGCTNRPFYRIVAAHNKCPRDGRFVEQLGSYDPLPNSHGEKIVALNLDRIRHWIGCGAHLSKPVEKLLGLSGFFPLHPMMITNAERLRRKRAREVLLASQKTDTEATETKTS
ncbi:small ribosomal subunit protein bS16m isoform X1 [Panthera onca]